MLQNVQLSCIVLNMNNNKETNAIVNSVIRSLEEDTFHDLVDYLDEEPANALEYVLNGGWDLPDQDDSRDDVRLDFESEDEILKQYGY